MEKLILIVAWAAISIVLVVMAILARHIVISIIDFHSFKPKSTYYLKKQDTDNVDNEQSTTDSSK